MTDGDLRIQSDRIARTLRIKKDIARLEVGIKNKIDNKDVIKNVYVGGVYINSPQAISFANFSEIAVIQIELTYLKELLEEI